jgi:asparagine N-glycosylation enzyme membrane subunit Stt3
MVEDEKSGINPSQEQKIENNEPISKKQFNSKNIGNFFKKNWFWILIIVLLIAIIFLSCNIRTSNVSQLKDVTTGNYTLGPDLDPFLFLRLAKEIVQGKLQNPDMMRAAPLGSENYAKIVIQPGAIALVYKLISPFMKFPEKSVEFAAIITPVIFTAFAIVFFFLFIFVIFSFVMPKKFAAIGGIIAAAFYAILPEMLHRTTAGIPEVESLGMVWFWLAFLFFALAWKQDKLKKMIPLAIIAGLFTSLMVWTWGGSKYLFMTFGLAAFLIFLFNKDKKKNFLIFSCWFIPSFILYVVRSGLINSISSLSDIGFCLIIFSILLIDLILFNTKLKKIKEKIKLPESIISLILIIIIGFLFLLVFKPDMISQIFSRIIEGLIYPFGRGRVGLTVAEQHAPYFVEVFGSFSWLFWTFFIGTIFLFFEAIKHFDKNKKIWLNITFIIFLITFIFSRISSSSILNGENTISIILYFAGLIIFILTILSIYIYSYIKKDEKTLNDFKKINLAYILILAFTFWMVVSMRGAIRLFFIVSPAIVISSVFLPLKISEYALKAKDNFYKIVLWVLVAVVTIILILNFINYEKNTSQQAKYTVNGAYYQQWQKAMAWVRDDTPKDSIFVHWWDYGYWVQTLGERATVVDGGHPAGFNWNHLVARYLLTAQNETTALQFCKAHNVSYLLIDSTDIGKYSAFGSIGSDKTGLDRLSWISTFGLNEKQTQETKNETIYVYTGGTMLDEDILWQGEILPMQRAGIGAFLLSIDKTKQTINSLDAIVIYNDQQIKIPIRYLWFNGRKYDLKKDDEKMLNSMLYIVPSISNTGINNLGGALYLSEKALRTEWVKLYLLNESENFELVHTEPSLFVKQLKDVYNITVGDFVLAGDLQGPIKIWKVKYPASIAYYPEYLEEINVEADNAWGKLDYLGV